MPQGGSSESSPDVHRHRKSHSLDATANKSSKTSTQTVRERFRCITPYPPNSDYELELQVSPHLQHINPRSSQETADQSQIYVIHGIYIYLG